MLTKTLKFSDEVLEVLRGMEWRADGGTGKITAQLDRALYVQVNKALEAMGGKWNRGVGAHTFTADPRSQVEGLLAAGTLEVDRDGFFETPQAVILRMLDLVPVQTGVPILEPSAGTGAIAKVLRDHGATEQRLRLVEQNIDRVMILRNLGFQCECADFMQYTLTGFAQVYMNPPFENGQDMDHVMHAYDLLAAGGTLISVMGEGAFFRTDRKANDFRTWRVKVNARDASLPDGAFKESGTGVKTRLLWVRKNTTGQPAQAALF